MKYSDLFFVLSVPVLPLPKHGIADRQLTGCIVTALNARMMRQQKHL